MGPFVFLGGFVVGVLVTLLTGMLVSRVPFKGVDGQERPDLPGHAPPGPHALSSVHPPSDEP